MAALAAGADDIAFALPGRQALFAQKLTLALRRGQADGQTRQLQRLLDSAPDAMLVVNQEGVVRYVNQTAVGLFGRDRRDLVGERFGYSVGDGEPTEIRILRGADTRICEMRVVGLDWHAEPCLVAAIRDITEMRQLSERLQHAHKMEAIGNLTGGIAHDVNNLLGIIIGALELADPAAPNHDELLGEATRAAQRGAELTQALLSFARRQTLNPLRLDVAEVCADVVRMLRRTLGPDVEISLTVGAELWPMVADRAQLQTCLIALANNARDAMPLGGRLLIALGNETLDAGDAAAQLDLSPGDYLRIEVSDTGTGMPSQVLHRVFDPFFTTKQPGRGTGLGLSMVFGFIKQSGGHITAYSEQAVGTSFRLYLPRAGGRVRAEPPPTPPSSPPRGEGETVLLVEDDPALARILAAQLASLGYRSLAARDAAEALALLDREHGQIRLALTDLAMPGAMDGLGLAGESAARWPGIRVVLASGFPARSLGARATPANGQPPMLTKPFGRHELAHMLRALLDG